MSFHWPYLLWLLLLPLALAVVELRRRRAHAFRLSHPKILRAEAGMHELELRSTEGAQAAGETAPRLRWRMYLGLALLVAALARPQWGHLDEPVYDQAREIMIALDLSRSMLAPDVRPSRLERARLLVTSLLERLTGERVGLIVFSGTAFLQSPLSSDYEILNEFLPSLNPDYLPEGGTNYRALIDTALTAFASTSSADRFLIILSDGEATDENWRSAVAELKAKGVRVIGLGIGTAQGSILPDGKGGFIKDERGAVVMSKLEPATLQELAKLTSGVYVDASSWIDLSQIIQSTVETGRQGKFVEVRQARFVERFQWALAPALAFLLWSFYADFPVRPRLREIKLRRTRPAVVPSAKQTPVEAAAMLALLGVLLVSSHRASAEETSAAAPLSKLVGQFSARETLSARDYADLAQTTITYGQRQQSAQQPVLEGPIRDGLAAVAAGQALDAQGADWAKLRAALEKLLEKPESPDQKKDKSDKQDQDKKDQDKKDSQDKDQKDSKSQKDSQQNKQKSDSSNPAPDDKQGDQKDQQDKQDKDDASKGSEGKDKEPKPDEKEQQSAFGKMDKKPEDPNKKPQPTPSSETQKVGGNPDQKASSTPADPSMVVPLQRLQQLRNQDSPVRLEQLMRGNQPTPATTGKNW